MTKIALITDLHFGVRNDNKALLANQEKFFSNIFFPYMDSYDIKHLINLGDTVDRRKYINFNTSSVLTGTLMEPLYERGIESHFILGNHDVSFRDNNDTNALDELYGNSKYLEYLKIYKNPAEINIGGLDILLLPWITGSNKDISIEAITNSKCTHLMGHLDIIGFEMYRGSVADHGFDKKIFDQYEMVCSGHFHHKSTVGNIHYLGSTGQYTWSDYGDGRGFHILDTETRELEFVANPYYMFNKFVYDDSAKTSEEMLAFNGSKYSGSYVKIIVKNKKDPYLLEKVIDKFEKHDIINLSVIEDKVQLEIESDEELLDEAEDTLTILSKYIAQLNYHESEKLQKFMTELYNQALTVE